MKIFIKKTEEKLTGKMIRNNMNEEEGNRKILSELSELKPEKRKRKYV